MKPGVIIAFTIVLLLSGCMTPEQRAAYQAQQQQQQAAQAAQQAEQAAQFEASQKQYCTDMGAPPGSLNYYNCRRHLECMQRLQPTTQDAADATYQTTFAGRIVTSQEIANQRAQDCLQGK